MQLSEKAAVALEAVRKNQEIPESHETRLSPSSHPDGNLAIRLDFVEEAQETDQVAERAGTEVFVDSTLAEPLSDAVMDVDETPDGLSFVFRTNPV